MTKSNTMRCSGDVACNGREKRNSVIWLGNLKERNNLDDIGIYLGG